MENLVFCGGGSKIYALIGALKELDRRGYLKSFFRCAGSSSGGLIASLWGVGATIEQIEDIIVNQDLSEYSKNFLENNLIESAFRLITFYGYYDSANIADWMYEIYETRLGVKGDITFKEAYELTGREVVITGTNLNRGKTAYFSHRTAPDMMLKEAVRITVSIPFYFSSVEYKKEIYVDGGLLCNYPIHTFDKVDPKFEKTLSFKFLSSYQKTGHCPINNFMEFLDSIIDCSIEHSSNFHIKEEKFKKYVMIIDTDGHYSRNIDISLEARHRLIKIGQNEARKWLKTHRRIFKRSSPHCSVSKDIRTEDCQVYKGNNEDKAHLEETNESVSLERTSTDNSSRVEVDSLGGSIAHTPPDTFDTDFP